MSDNFYCKSIQINWHIKFLKKSRFLHMTFFLPVFPAQQASTQVLSAKLPPRYLLNDNSKLLTHSFFCHRSPSKWVSFQANMKISGFFYYLLAFCITSGAKLRLAYVLRFFQPFVGYINYTFFDSIALLKWPTESHFLVLARPQN